MRLDFSGRLHQNKPSRNSIMINKGPAEKALVNQLIKAGSHYLYYHLNNLNAEKSHTYVATILRGT